MISRRLIAVILALAGILLAVPAGHSEEKPAAQPAEAAKNAEAQKPVKKAEAKQVPLAVTEEAIQELENRKKRLDEREAALDERARALDVQEKILKDKLQKLEELNKKMADRLDAYKKEHEERVTKVVSMMETMKPQAAAEYVENLEPVLAVEVLSRIQVQKAAKIMNLVDKKKAARLSEMYTGYRDVEDNPAPADKKEVPAKPQQL